MPKYMLINRWNKRGEELLKLRNLWCQAYHLVEFKEHHMEQSSQESLVLEL